MKYYMIMCFQEQERSDLLEQYRRAAEDMERFEVQTHQLESEGSNLRMQLMSRDTEIRRLREKLNQIERENQEVRNQQC